MTGKRRTAWSAAAATAARSVAPPSSAPKGHATSDAPARANLAWPSAAAHTRPARGWLSKQTTQPRAPAPAPGTTASAIVSGARVSTKATPPPAPPVRAAASSSRSSVAASAASGCAYRSLAAASARA